MKGSSKAYALKSIWIFILWCIITSPSSVLAEWGWAGSWNVVNSSQVNGNYPIAGGLETIGDNDFMGVYGGVLCSYGPYGRCNSYTSGLFAFDDYWNKNSTPCVNNKSSLATNGKGNNFVICGDSDIYEQKSGLWIKSSSIPSELKGKVLVDAVVDDLGSVTSLWSTPIGYHDQWTYLPVSYYASRLENGSWAKTIKLAEGWESYQNHGDLIVDSNQNVYIAILINVSPDNPNNYPYKPSIMSFLVTSYAGSDWQPLQQVTDGNPSNISLGVAPGNVARAVWWSGNGFGDAFKGIEAVNGAWNPFVKTIYANQEINNPVYALTNSEGSHQILIYKNQSELPESVMWVDLDEIPPANAQTLPIPPSKDGELISASSRQGGSVVFLKNYGARYHDSNWKSTPPLDAAPVSVALSII